MDLGYVTHAVHANSRLVYLVASLDKSRKTLSIVGPPDGNVYPPGPGWIYVVVDGMPSMGVKMMIGNGQGPSVDGAAWEKCVRPHYGRIRPDAIAILFFQSFEEYQRRSGLGDGGFWTR
jgi:hypothetical protein